MVLLQRKLYLFTDQEGVQYFPGGQTFSRGGGGGVQMLISIDTHITCDFPGGGGSAPYPSSGSSHVKLLNIAFLLALCFSICYTCWYDVSLSAVSAGMVSHYQPCLLVWCFIIYRSCFFGWYITIIHACWCGASL